MRKFAQIVFQKMYSFIKNSFVICNISIVFDALVVRNECDSNREQLQKWIHFSEWSWAWGWGAGWGWLGGAWRVSWQGSRGRVCREYMLGQYWWIFLYRYENKLLLLYCYGFIFMVNSDNGTSHYLMYNLYTFRNLLTPSSLPPAQTAQEMIKSLTQTVIGLSFFFIFSLTISKENFL